MAWNQDSWSRAFSRPNFLDWGRLGHAEEPGHRPGGIGAVAEGPGHLAALVPGVAVQEMMEGAGWRW